MTDLSDRELLEFAANPVREAMRQVTALPHKYKPAADLTEREKLALCIAAGAPTEVLMDGRFMTIRTTVPCGAQDRRDGGYIVSVAAQPLKSGGR